MKKSIALLCGGGPAPGINSVISSVAKAFLYDGYRVLGIHEGYKGLFSENPKIREIDFKLADEINKRGGSALIMSRFKPKDSEFNTNFFVKHNVKLLVTIGGDDTASTANRISKFLHENDVPIQNIHVPKTIDNDLPLPEGISTFGYQSAKQEGVRIAQTVYEDARTSGNWFVVSAMGREAGHLAFGIGAASHFPMIIIPEMFNKVPVTFDLPILLRYFTGSSFILYFLYAALICISIVQPYHLSSISSRSNLSNLIARKGPKSVYLIFQKMFIKNPATMLPILD